MVDSLDRDTQAKHEQERYARRLAVAPAKPRFVVGQVIITEEEYEALPKGATVFPQRPDGATWHWERMGCGFSPTEMGVGSKITQCHEMASIPRTIRSLPPEAA